MSKIKVLVVEDNERWQVWFVQKFGNDFDIFQAHSKWLAREFFEANPDIGIIIMDACLDDHIPDTLDLTRDFRVTFSGKIIASSSSEIYREQQVKAGCSHSCHKDDLFEKFLEIVNS